jgi:hypothetical protein
MDKVTRIEKPVEFTIDGRPYSTTDRQQLAVDLLRLAGLDPALYDLGEVHGQRPQPKRYQDHEPVTIRPGARFVSIRQRADVA